MQEKQGLRADAYTYSLLMDGYALAKQPDMAFMLVSTSPSSHDNVTFHIPGQYLLAGACLVQRPCLAY